MFRSRVERKTLSQAAWSRGGESLSATRGPLTPRPLDTSSLATGCRCVTRRHESGAETGPGGATTRRLLPPLWVTYKSLVQGTEPGKQQGPTLMEALLTGDGHYSPQQGSFHYLKQQQKKDPLVLLTARQALCKGTTAKDVRTTAMGLCNKREN